MGSRRVWTRLQEQRGDRKGRKRIALACLEAGLRQVFCWHLKVTGRASVFRVRRIKNKALATKLGARHVGSH